MRTVRLLRTDRNNEFGGYSIVQYAYSVPGQAYVYSVQYVYNVQYVCSAYYGAQYLLRTEHMSSGAKAYSTYMALGSPSIQNLRKTGRLGGLGQSKYSEP